MLIVNFFKKIPTFVLMAYNARQELKQGLYVKRGIFCGSFSVFEPKAYMNTSRKNREKSPKITA